MISYPLTKEVKVIIEGREIIKELNENHLVMVIETKEFGKLLLMGTNENDLTVQFSESDEVIYHELLTHPAMALVSEVNKVLIIGGGDGGVAREVLKYPIKEVTLVDIDKKVIDFTKKYLPIDNGALDKVKIIIDDGRKFVENSEEKFDVIILDLTDPEGPSKLLFTKEFYQAVKKILNKNGVLAMQVSSPLYDPQVMGRVRETLTKIFNEVGVFSYFIPSFFAEEGFCIATDNKIGDITDNIKSEAFKPEELQKIIKIKSPAIKKLLLKKWEETTDKNPVVHSGVTSYDNSQ